MEGSYLTVIVVGITGLSIKKQGTYASVTLGDDLIKCIKVEEINFDWEKNINSNNLKIYKDRKTRWFYLLLRQI